MAVSENVESSTASRIFMRAIFPGSDVLACLPDLENSEEDKRFGLVRGIGLQTGIFGARDTESGGEDFAKSQVGMSLRERVQRQFAASL
jgi:hypothetical protein